MNKEEILYAMPHAWASEQRRAHQAVWRNKIKVRCVEVTCEAAKMHMILANAPNTVVLERGHRVTARDKGRLYINDLPIPNWYANKHARWYVVLEVLAKAADGSTHVIYGKGQEWEL